MRHELSFEPQGHTYHYRGKTLSGITGKIGKRLNKNFVPTIAVEDAREFGSLIHKDIEEFIKIGARPEHPVSVFIISFLEKNYPPSEYSWASELLVSDYKDHATAIDLVVWKQKGKAIIFDIKTGNFDREYCAFQLGIGKIFLEKDGDFKVAHCKVIATKEQWVYDVRPKSEARCLEVLYGVE